MESKLLKSVEWTSHSCLRIHRYAWMIEFLTINLGLHEDLKPYMGNAIYTSSDSYKNVGVMQPKNYVRRKTN